MSHTSAFRILPLPALMAVGRAGGDWTRFRGPNGSGVDTAAGYPVAFWPTATPVAV